MFELRQVATESVQYVADNMRQGDAIEVWASHRFTPHEALNAGIKDSQYAAVAWIDDEPVAVYGLRVESVTSGIGVPWLLATESAMKHKSEFLKQSPSVVRNMLNICPKLYNYVHVENKASIRWLKWLGFEFDEPIPYGEEGEMFQRFHRELGH